MPKIDTIFIKHTRCISGAPHPVLRNMVVHSEVQQFVDNVWVAYTDMKKAAEVPLEMERKILYAGQDRDAMFPGMFWRNSGWPNGYLQFRCPFVDCFEKAVAAMNAGAMECIAYVYHGPGSGWESLTEKSWMCHDLVVIRLGGTRSNWYHIRRATDKDGKQLARRHKHVTAKYDRVQAKRQLELDYHQIDTDSVSLRQLLRNMTQGKIRDTWEKRSFAPEIPETVTLDQALEAWQRLVVNRPKASVVAWLKDIHTGDKGFRLNDGLGRHVARLDEILSRWRKEGTYEQYFGKLGCMTTYTFENQIWPKIVRFCKKHNPKAFED